MLIINNLAPNHPLRNTPLGNIGAESKWKSATENGKWTHISTLSKQMQKATFNELGKCWLEDWWRVND